MNAAVTPLSRPALPPSARYAKVIEASKRVRWDIDRDVLKGRRLDFDRKFLPDGLTKVAALPFLRPGEARFFSQVQGRSYANIFGLVERYIGAKTLEVSRDYWLGDQVALEALVRFADEELKHQELFRRIERLCAEGMPKGYALTADPDAVARAVLACPTWSVLGLTLHIEIFTQDHYRASIEPDTELSDLWKDVFRFHWMEESQHAILDELEWRRADAHLGEADREAAVDGLIGLVGAVDGILQAQAAADAAYFLKHLGRALTSAEQALVHDTFLRAYRWQYIVSGVQNGRFLDVLKALVTPAQLERIGQALSPIVAHAGA